MKKLFLLTIILSSCFLLFTNSTRATLDTSTIYSVPPAWGTGNLYTIDQNTWQETNETPLYFADNPTEGIEGGFGMAYNPQT
ncbi:MAG: hypothetical protein U9Q12_01135, partial [Patescibacteria group bacterium]|nr:hypothetical protein [Patescibacteria group bacterium]